MARVSNWILAPKLSALLASDFARFWIPVGCGIPSSPSLANVACLSSRALVSSRAS